MKRSHILTLCLVGFLLLALTACGGESAETEQKAETNTTETSENTGTSVQEDDAAGEEETLVAYTGEGLGTFQLPEGFTMDSGEITEPLPNRYATFQKDSYYIQANRFGTDAYEMAGVALPADLEDYSTRSGVQNSVPEGTVFDYDEYGNYAAQFTQEDGQLCYYVLLQGEESFGSIFLTAPEDQFDKETVALWLSGSQLE